MAKCRGQAGPVRKHRKKTDGKFVPLYKRTALEIKKSIDTGLWAAGFQLPKLKHLASMMGVSYGTVSHAVTLLEKRGYLEVFHAQGVFVTSIETREYAARMRRNH